MAEEVGERLGAAFAAELAAGAVDDPAPVHRTGPTDEELHFVSVLEQSAAEPSRMSLQHVQRARDSVILIGRKLASGANPAVMVLSGFTFLTMLVCVAGAIMSLEADGGLHFARQDVSAKQHHANDSIAGDIRGMSDRGASPLPLSKTNALPAVPRSVEAVPTVSFQSRRVARAGSQGSGSQSGSPKVVEPPPFYTKPPPQVGEGSSPLLRQQPWSQQPLASSSSSEVLPALCPLLVLPACESHFAVPFAMLRISSVPFEFDIVGLSLTPLLHTCVKQAGSGGRCLEISMVKHYSWNGNSPHATVLPIAEAGNGKNAFEVLGHGRQVFGTLQLEEPGDPARYVLTRRDQLVLTIHKDEQGRMIRVTNSTGGAVCSVERVDDFGGAEHLQFRVPPGIDAVLVLSCVLATFVLVR